MSVLATADLSPPPPYPKLTLTCYQLTIVGLGEGYVCSCLDTDIDPSFQYFFHGIQFHFAEICVVCHVFRPSYFHFLSQLDQGRMLIRKRKRPSLAVRKIPFHKYPRLLLSVIGLTPDVRGVDDVLH